MKRRSALVVVTSSFPIANDGSEAAGAFVADLAEALSEDVPVRVVAPGKEEEVERWSNNVDVFRYAAPEQPLSTLRPWHPKDASVILSVLMSGARATEAAASSASTAHLFALWALPCGEWTRRVAARHGIDYSIWALGSDIWGLGRIPLVRMRLRTILRGASHCWADGLKLAEDTKAIAGREVGFLPSTRRLDTARVSPRRSSPPFRLLFLGRWHPNKGIDLLIRALQLLTDVDWARIEKVLIAGGGPLHDEVMEGVANLQARGRPVVVTGYLGRLEAAEALGSSDFLLLPSRIESIPVVFSDAMKLALPVVATPVGDLPALICNETGVLAADVSAEAFCRAISEAITGDFRSSDATLQMMSAQFSIEATARTILGMAV